MPGRDLHLFSIPPGAPFLDTLADALLSGRLVGDVGWGSDPLGFSGLTIYLPTRRAARALAGLLSARAAGPLLLPRITPLGDADEAELRLIGDGDLGDGEDAPAAGEAQRLVTLADLVMRWRDRLAEAIVPLGPADHRLIPGPATEAFALAADLAGVLDTLTIEGVDAGAIERAAPAEHDRYWSIARDFLAIATRYWPDWLADRGLSDPAARRNAVLRRRAGQVAAGGGGPILAAGSTGTNPATAALLAAIARHPRGAVVLPALDLLSPEEVFASIDGEAPQPGHPQAALAKLMMRLGARRHDVEELAAPPPPLRAREQALAEAMRPPAFTVGWATARVAAAGAIAAALRGAVVIEAENDREEALAVALAMREAVETPARTAALATPDRALAERVEVALGRWEIAVDDSAGRSLARSPRGALAALAARWLAAPADGALLSALVSHPFAACGLHRDDCDRAGPAIDIGLLRGYPPAASLAALRSLAPERRAAAAGRGAPRPARRFGDADWRSALRSLDALLAVEREFARGGARRPLAARILAFRAALEALSADQGGAVAIFEGRDGEALRDLFDAVAAEPDRAPLSRGDFPAVLARLLDSVTLNPAGATHPRLSIWGLLEARLLSVDRIILAGLNETVWPPQPPPDAFLNRSLRAALNLPQPERRIGQTAHDFVSLFGGAEDAILTRARKSGGAPTVPSRFWRRLAAYAGAELWQEALARGERYLALARRLDDSPRAEPARRPEPKPPSQLIPRRLSVSRIETLVRDPYAIYAREVLALDPLPAIGETADAALRGTLIHDAVAQFAREIDPFDPDAVKKLIAIGERKFDEAVVGREQRLFWRPRFRKAAALYVEWERVRRPFLANLDIERQGAIRLPLSDGTAFELVARADRIELLKGGSLAIVDFKTGAAPTGREVAAGFSPQLTLEAAMARRGAFAEAHRGRRVADLIYVRLSGGKSGDFATNLTDPGNKKPLDPSTVAERHLDQLRRRIEALIAGRAGFLSWAHRHRDDPNAEGDYDHLARVAEWSRGGDDE